MRAEMRGLLHRAPAGELASSHRPCLPPLPCPPPPAVLRELDAAGAIMLDGEDIYLAH